MMNKKSKIILSLVTALLVLTPSLAVAQGPVDPSFNPGFLISDEAFADTGTFGSADGVQQFLQSKGSVLARTDTAFLTMLREPADTSLKTALDDPHPSLNRLRTAAEIIYDASQSAGLNAQVMLVTLQKEQSLITGTQASDDALQRALDHALGYGCPDSSPCQANFLGFYSQFFGNLDANGDRWIGAAKSLSKSFSYVTNGVRTGRGPLIDGNSQTFGGGPYVRPAQKGDTITLDNTLGGFDGVSATQNVTIGDFATAALYRYTPHVFNGNYNFWRFYQSWFRYPNGTVIKLMSDPTLWVIDNGFRRQFSSFVASQRGINATSPVVVSQTEFSSYVQGTQLVPKDGTLIKSDIDPTTYLIDGGKKRKVTAFTASQRKLNLANTVTLPAAEVASYDNGDNLLPLEGTLIQAKGDAAVFMMVGGQKEWVSFPIFQQRKFKFASVAVLPSDEVAAIAAGPSLPPQDGTLVKSVNSQAVFVVDSGTKRWVSYAVWLQRKYKASSIMTLSDDQINALTNGNPIPPLDNTLVQAQGDPTIYLVQQGSKAYIPGKIFIMDKWYAKPVLALTAGEITAMPTSDHPVAPKDGTLVQAIGDATVYLVEKGQLRPLSYQAFVNRKYKWSNVKIFEGSDLAQYERGQAITK